MPGYVKVSGVWSKAAPWGKVSGTWAKAKEAYANVAGTWKQWWLDGGVNDRTFTEFDVYSGFNITVNSVAIQSNSKIIVVGQFTIFNGATVNRIVRLNSDGTRDTTFTANTGTAFNDGAGEVTIQSDDKILVGGAFTTFNGATVNNIVRLNSDGTRDTAFTTNNGTGFNGSVLSIVVQSDGKIICVGDFTTFNGSAVGRIARLNSDGTQDTTFTTNVGLGASGPPGVREVYVVALQSDGKIIAGGTFGFWSGTTVNGIVRLNSDGTRDTTFTTNVGAAFNNAVISLATQSDGKILIGGDFTTFNGVTVNRIVRLNSDGTRDTAFTANTGTAFNSTAYSIAIQTDGKIVIGGSFTTFNGVTVNRIVRLNSDGTRDTTFTTNNGTGFSNDIYSIAIQSDGKIVIGGAFQSFNNTSRTRLARIGGE